MALITSENARQMADIGRQKRHERIMRARAAANLVPLPADDSYRERRLARVRNQLAMVDQEIEDGECTDSKRLKELTDAQSRLAEQERILAGRPMPGSLKPSSKPARRSAPAEPMPETEIGNNDISSGSIRNDSRCPAADDPSAPNG